MGGGDQRGSGGGQLIRRTGELGEEPGPPVRQGLDRRPGLRPRHDGGERLVHALQRHQAPLPEQFRDRVGRVAGVGETEDHQRAVPRRVDQPELRRQHDRAGALGADEDPGEVEAVLRQQLLKRVARDLSREATEPRAQQFQVGLGEFVQPSDERATLAPLGGGPVDLLTGHLPDGHHGAAIGHDLKLQNVLRRTAPGERVRAAGVVTDHPAEGATAVRRGVGAEEEPVRGRGGLQVVQDDARLHGGLTGRRVEFQKPVVEAREVQHDAGAHGLPGGTGARAPAGDREPEFAAGGHGVDHLLPGAGEDDGARHPPVVGGVRRILSQPTGIGRDLAAVRPAQRVGVLGRFRGRAGVLDRDGHVPFPSPGRGGAEPTMRGSTPSCQE